MEKPFHISTNTLCSKRLSVTDLSGSKLNYADYTVMWHSSWLVLLVTVSVMIKSKRINPFRSPPGFSFKEKLSVVSLQTFRPTNVCSLAVIDEVKRTCGWKLYNLFPKQIFLAGSLVNWGMMFSGLLWGSFLAERQPPEGGSSFRRRQWWRKWNSPVCVKAAILWRFNYVSGLVAVVTIFMYWVKMASNASSRCIIAPNTIGCNRTEECQIQHQQRGSCSHLDALIPQYLCYAAIKNWQCMSYSTKVIQKTKNTSEYTAIITIIFTMWVKTSHWKINLSLLQISNLGSSANRTYLIF